MRKLRFLQELSQEKTKAPPPPPPVVPVPKNSCFSSIHLAEGLTGPASLARFQGPGGCELETKALTKLGNARPEDRGPDLWETCQYPRRTAQSLPRSLWWMQLVLGPTSATSQL